MLPLIEKHLLHHWSEILPDNSVPEKLHFLLSGEKAIKNKTALVFAGNNPLPLLIIKIARSEYGAHFLETEFNALTHAFSAFKNKPGKINIPQPILFDYFGNDKALIETVVPGESLEATWGRLHEKAWQVAFNKELKTITGILIELKKNLSVKNKDIHLTDFAQKSWEHFCSAYTPTTHEKETFNRIVTSSLCKRQQKLPAVWLHGDFWIGNILQTSNDRLGLIDWEQTRDAGLPFWDLFFFITTATLYSPFAHWDKYPEQGLATCFAAQSPVQHSIKQAIRHINSTINLPEEDLATLFHLFLLDMATFHFQEYGFVKKQDEIFRDSFPKDITLL